MLNTNLLPSLGGENVLNRLGLEINTAIHSLSFKSKKRAQWLYLHPLVTKFRRCNSTHPPPPPTPQKKN